MEFDPKAIITLRVCERMSRREQEAYDRAHLLQVIREEGEEKLISEFSLETAPLDQVLAAYSNAIDLGAASPGVARAWLIGRYHERDQDEHPEDWPDGPVPVG